MILKNDDYTLYHDFKKVFNAEIILNSDDNIFDTEWKYVAIEKDNGWAIGVYDETLDFLGYI